MTAGILSSLPLFDCSTFLGRLSGQRSGHATKSTCSTLAAEMTRLGVTKAVTYHILAQEYDPSVGNAALTSELSQPAPEARERLVPCWVVMPSHTGELPPTADLVSEMRRAGVSMARMFPATTVSGHRFTLSPWCVGELLGGLERCAMPTALDFTLFRRSEPPWEVIAGVAERHPRLPLVLMDVQGRNNRSLYPLLAAYPNLYVQTAGLNVHRGIEDVCERFGPSRLLYGSGYPRGAMGSARLQLERALISEDDKVAIASGNLEQLIDGIDR